MAKPSNKLRYRMAFGLSLILIVFIIIIFGMAYQEVSRWLYPPPLDFRPESVHPSFQDITLQTEDRLTIYGTYIPSQNGQVILMLHGHSGNRFYLLAHSDYLIEAGYGILSIDFRNHGDSDGDRTSMGLHELKDAHSAYDFLKSQEDIENIIIFGHSMGGAIATRLMVDVDAHGLIIDASFADFPSTVSAGVVKRGFPDRPVTTILLTMYSLLSGADFDMIHPLEHMKQIDTPVLILHGTLDPVIPLDHAYQLAEANPLSQLEIFDGGEHSNLYELDPERYQTAILSYLNQLN